MIQPIFEIIDTASESEIVSRIFVIFIWFLLITITLAFAFRHYLRKFGSVETSNLEAVQTQFLHPTQSLSEFSNATGLDQQASEELLNLDEDQTPWYMELFLGIGGVITAILASLFVGLLLSITFGIENEIVLMVLGLVILGASITARRKNSNLFTRHMFNTFILAGAGLALVGFQILLDFSVVGSAAGIGLFITIMFLVKDRILEFILALGITGFLVHIILDLNVPKPGIVLAFICTAAAMILMTTPIRKRLYFAGGVAFLMSAPVQIIFSDLQTRSILGGDVPFSGFVSPLILLAVMIGAIVFLNRKLGLSRESFRPEIWLLIPLGLIAVIMPLGSSLALLAILVGYIIGSWPIAVVGVLYQIYFLVLFYYDLGITLLEKSILLFISGIALLILWRVVQHRTTPSSEAAS